MGTAWSDLCFSLLSRLLLADRAGQCNRRGLYNPRLDPTSAPDHFPGIHRVGLVAFVPAPSPSLCAMDWRGWRDIAGGGNVLFASPRLSGDCPAHSGTLGRLGPSNEAGVGSIGQPARARISSLELRS